MLTPPHVTVAYGLARSARCVFTKSHILASLQEGGHAHASSGISHATSACISRKGHTPASTADRCLLPHAYCLLHLLEGDCLRLPEKTMPTPTPDKRCLPPRALLLASLREGTPTPPLKEGLSSPPSSYTPYSLLEAYCGPIGQSFECTSAFIYVAVIQAYMFDALTSSIDIM